MADHTHIEWTDATWNPITGCSVVSAGCKHCYAMKLAGTRLQHHASRAGLTVETKAGPVWNGQVRFNEGWLHQPLKWKRPRRIFVCAHGDLFHENVPDQWIDAVFAVMCLAPQHSFQVLTKRAERMRAYCTSPHTLGRVLKLVTDALAGDGKVMAYHEDDGLTGILLPNVWLGVSVEDQAAADERIPLLLQTPAAVRWVSAEPLLGPVDLLPFFDPTGACCGREMASCPDCPAQAAWIHGPATVYAEDGSGYSAPTIDWVVAGGESGTGARPMHPDWARSLRDQCAEAGVPFLFKQWGAWFPADQTIEGSLVPIPEEEREVHYWDRELWSRRVGKKAAGRLLDGVLHDGYPEPR